MRTFRSLQELRASLDSPSVVSIGNFDGVHRGHTGVIADVVKQARARKAESVLITFDPHPAMVLRPDQAPQMITPTPMKLELLAETGVDAVLLLKFTRAFSQTTAEEFAEKILRRGLRTVEVHEGDNFHFGHGARESVAGLGRLGRKLGFEVKVHPPLMLGGKAVSSSRVRDEIAAGRMAAARELLGRPFAIRGEAAKGRGIGTARVVPTVNFGPYEGLLPANGVYVTTLQVGGKSYESVTNIGDRPTFGKPSFAVEAHVLGDFKRVVAPGTPIELTFLKRLRGERKWPSAEALKRQIGKDVTRAREYFSQSR